MFIRRKMWSSISFLLVVTLLLQLAQVNGKSPFLNLVETDNKHGYENVVVAVSNTVAKDPQIIEGIKKLFTEASYHLVKSTKGHAHFRQVTILVPEDWRDIISELAITDTSKFETFTEADVQITSETEIPNAQRTIRSEGCGKHGLHIQLSPTFLLDSNVADNIDANAKILTKEWAIYRYGVFEECGYEGDEMFPHFYYQSNQTLPTTCTNVPLNGKLQGNCDVDPRLGIPGSECQFTADENQTSLESSLLFKPWPEVAHFCNESTHNALAPTKQNILCQERSAWEVIVSNEDFKDLFPLSFTPAKPPTFTIVTTSKTNYVVLMDYSSSMSLKLKGIKSSMHRFLKNYVPTNNSVGLVFFDEHAEVKRELTLLDSDQTRQTMFDSITDTSNLESVTNIDHAITKGQEMLSDPNIFGRKVMIIISTGNWSDDGHTDTMCSKLQQDKIRLVFIITPEENENMPHEKLDAIHHLVSCSNGIFYVIPGIQYETHPKSVEELDTALRESILPNELEDVVVQIHHKIHGNNGTRYSGNFTIDESVKKYVTFRLTTETWANVKNLTLYGPDDEIYDDSAPEYKKDDSSSAILFKFPYAKPGNWKYEINLHRQFIDSSTVAAVISEAKTRNNIIVKCWTNVQNKAVSAKTTPVILYAEVKQGFAAVEDVRVFATIKTPLHKKTSEWTIHTVELFDDGNGDPDIAARDGIFSRYFIGLETEGFYTFTVQVIGNENSRVIQEKPLESNKTEIRTPTCKKAAIYAKRVGYFERYALGSSFYIAEAIGEDAEDVFPPNRITDLRMHSVNAEKGLAILQWTAPGDDYDHGKVSTYEIRYSMARQDLQKDHFHKAKLATHQIQHVPAGTPNVELTVQFPAGNQYFFAIKTKDKKGNESPISNIVSAFKAKKPTPKTDEFPLINDTITATNGTEAGTEGADNAKIGTIIGIVFAAVLLITIIAVVWWVTVNRRRKKKQVKARTAEYSKVPQESGAVAEEGGAAKLSTGN